MTIKRIRSELEAIRETLSAPAAASAPSAFDDINARLGRLAVRHHEAGHSPSAADIASLSVWWRQKFDQELTT